MQKKSNNIKREHTALPVILSYEFVLHLSWVCSTAVSTGTWPRGPLSAVKAKEEDLMQASVTG